MWLHAYQNCNHRAISSQACSILARCIPLCGGLRTGRFSYEERVVVLIPSGSVSRKRLFPDWELRFTLQTDGIVVWDLWQAIQSQQGSTVLSCNYRRTPNRVEVFSKCRGGERPEPVRARRGLSESSPGDLLPAQSFTTWTQAK
jgi:hypothetical protein